MEFCGNSLVVRLTLTAKRLRRFGHLWAEHQLSVTFFRFEQKPDVTVLFVLFFFDWALGEKTTTTTTRVKWGNDNETTEWGSVLCDQMLCTMISINYHAKLIDAFIVQELRESRGGRPGLSVLTSLLVSMDVKIYWTVLQHWSQLVPNMSTDIWGH